MRILLDENLPTDLIEALRALGHDVAHVCSRNLAGHPDPDVRALAEAEERLLITQDIRFADARAFVRGEHGGIALVRLKKGGLREIIETVRTAFEKENVESWAGCFVVLSESKLRIRRPP
jgi:predicted nuclease of predicted toxin-antitoxin system